MMGSSTSCGNLVGYSTSCASSCGTFDAVACGIFDALLLDIFISQYLWKHIESCCPSWLHRGPSWHHLGTSWHHLGTPWHDGPGQGGPSQVGSQTRSTFNVEDKTRSNTQGFFLKSCTRYSTDFLVDLGSQVGTDNPIRSDLIRSDLIRSGQIWPD